MLKLDLWKSRYHLHFGTTVIIFCVHSLPVLCFIILVHFVMVLSITCCNPHSRLSRPGRLVEALSSTLPVSPLNFPCLCLQAVSTRPRPCLPSPHTPKQQKGRSSGSCLINNTVKNNELIRCLF